MNRLANAFSTALPSADIASIRDSPRPSSPFEPASRQSERRWDSPAELYDDPRSPYDQPSASSSRNVSQPDRPGLARRATDEGLSRGLGLLRAGGGHERAGSRSRSRTPRRDRSVRTNLLGHRPKAWASAGLGGAKLTGLAKGPDGRYAVGGGHSLKIIQLNLDHRKDVATNATVIGRGDGGASVSEVVNLWKPSWGPQKGVTDLDWGSAAFSNKIVTASPMKPGKREGRKSDFKPRKKRRLDTFAFWRAKNVSSKPKKPTTKPEASVKDTIAKLKKLGLEPVWPIKARVNMDFESKVCLLCNC